MHSLWEPLAATYHDWGKHSTHKLVIVVDGFLCFPHWLQGDVTKCKDMNPFIYNIYVIYIYIHIILYIYTVCRIIYCRYSLSFIWSIHLIRYIGDDLSHPKWRNAPRPRHSFLSSEKITSWKASNFPGIELIYIHIYMAMGQYLLIPFLGGWTSINPSYFDVNYRGTIGFDTLPYESIWS